ncbi:hypothetical protein AAMO2058_001678400 [Amorphochlora amoebiformis]
MGDKVRMGPLAGLVFAILLAVGPQTSNRHLMRSKRRRMAAGGRNGAWVRRGGHRGIASRLTSRQMSQRVTTKPGEHKSVYVCKNNEYKEIRLIRVDQKIGWKAFLKLCKARLRMRRCERVFNIDGNELDLITERVVDLKRLGPLVISSGEDYVKSNKRPLRLPEIDMDESANKRSIRDLDVLPGGGGNRFTHVIAVRLVSDEVFAKVREFQEEVKSTANIDSPKCYVPVNALHIPLGLLKCSRHAAAKVAVALKAFETEEIPHFFPKILPYLLLTLQGLGFSRRGKELIIGIRKDKHAQVLESLRKSLKEHLTRYCPGELVDADKAWVPYCVAMKLKKIKANSPRRFRISEIVESSRERGFGTAVCCDLHLVTINIRNSSGTFPVLYFTLWVS